MLLVEDDEVEADGRRDLGKGRVIALQPGAEGLLA
jgi:hypothetical protein